MLRLEGIPNPKQEQFFLSTKRHIAYGGARGGGKAQPLNEPILTPNGFVDMKDVKVKDYVIGADGLNKRVLEIHPQGIQPHYRITTIDGASTRASEGHLWDVKVVGKRKRDILTTKQVFDLYNKNKNILLPLYTQPNRKKTNLPIKPYTFGVLLGDGCLVKRNEVSFSTADNEIVEYIKQDGYEVRTRKAKYNFGIADFVKENKYIDNMKLRVKSDLKYIPTEYKHHIEVLQGLFDTDGSVDTRGHIEFTTTSEQLALDVQEMIWYFGGKCTIRKSNNSYMRAGTSIKAKDKYRCYIKTKIDSELFKLLRKKERCVATFNGGVSVLQRRIINVEFIGEIECQCLTVEDDLYVTKDYIVTHNSWAMRRKFVLLALKYPGLKLLLLRRTLPELRENHQLPLQQELYGFAKFNSDEKAFIFPNGSRIRLGYCDTEKDVFQYQGNEYDVIGFEEATHFSRSQVDFLLTCNRSTRTDFSPRVYYTSNPGNVGHMWFKRLFIDREYQNKEKSEDYEFIQALVYDNDVLMATNPEYIEALENLPEDQKKAMLYGDWNVFEGQFFPEFASEYHIVKPFDIPQTWDIQGCIDYGLDMCAYYLVARDPEGHFYVCSEIHQSNLIVSDASEEIKKVEEKICGNNRTVEFRIAPPDIWNRNVQTGRSASDLFYEHGVDFIKGNNDRIAGWLALKEWLKPVFSKDIDGGREIIKTQLKIFSNCTNLIRCLPQLQHDPNKPNDVAKQPHDITHAPDSIRTLALYWQSGGQIYEDTPAIKFKWTEDLLEDYNNGTPYIRERMIEKYGKPN